MWFLPQVTEANANIKGACFVLPTNDLKLSFGERFKKLFQTA